MEIISHSDDIETFEYISSLCHDFNLIETAEIIGLQHDYVVLLDGNGRFKNIAMTFTFRYDYNDDTTFLMGNNNK